MFESFLRNRISQKHVLQAWRHLAKSLGVPDAGAAIAMILAAGAERAGETIAQLKMELCAAGLKPASVNVTLSGLRVFMNYLYSIRRIGWVLNVANLQFHFRVKDYDLPDGFSFDLDRLLPAEESSIVVRDRSILALIGLSWAQTWPDC
jgi:hypothetical protein